jgi:hypothetical protein
MMTAGALVLEYLDTIWISTISLADHPWILLIGIFAARMAVPICSPIRDAYMLFKDKNKFRLGKAEKKHYDNFRSHSITLASFTMAIIALIVAFPNPTQLSTNVKSLFYLSIAMTSFFISSYLFTFRQNRWFPFTGESLEYMGLVAVGIGLLGLIQNLTKGNPLLSMVYALFVIAVILIAALQIRMVINYFYPK